MLIFRLQKYNYFFNIPKKLYLCKFETGGATALNMK